MLIVRQTNKVKEENLSGLELFTDRSFYDKLLLETDMNNGVDEAMDIEVEISNNNIIVEWIETRSSVMVFSSLQS